MSAITKGWDEETRKLLESVGAIQTGHYVFPAGDHGRVCVNQAAILNDPDALDRVATWLAIAMLDAGMKVETVTGPALAGAILASHVARSLQTLQAKSIRFVPAACEAAKPVFIDGDVRLIRGKIVAVVEGILTQTSSVRRVVQRISDLRGSPQGVAVVCNYGDVKESDVMTHLVSLLTLDDERWPATDCLLCVAGVPISTDLDSGVELLARQPGHPSP